MARKKRKQEPGDSPEENGSVQVVEDEDSSELEMILDLDPNGLLVVEPETRQVFWANAAAEAMMKRPREQLLSEPFPEEVEEGPMRTLDLKRRLNTVSWQGQPATLVTLTTMSAANTNFTLEWRLEAAEERAREAEEMVEQLQKDLMAARKGASPAQDREAEILAELSRAQARHEQLEGEIRAAESRAEKAEERAKEAESLMEEAESQAQEAERHLEDMSDSVRIVEDELKVTQERCRELEAQIEAASTSSAAPENAAEVQSLREQTQRLQQELDAMLEKSRAWQQREAEIEEMEIVHLQALTELEQLREEKQTWQESQVVVQAPSDVEELQARLQETKENLDFLEIERAEVEEKWMESRAEVENLSRQLTQLEPLQARIHELEGLVKSLEELPQQLEQSQAAHNELKKQLEEEQQARSGADDLHSRVEQLQLELEESRAKQQALQEQASELEALLAESEGRSDDESWKSQVAALEASLEEAGLQAIHLQDHIGDVESRLQAAQERAHTLEQEVQVLQKKQQASEESLDEELEAQLTQKQRILELESQLQELEQQAQASLSELAGAKASLEKLEGQQADHEDLQTHLLSVEKERDGLIVRLDQSDTELWMLKEQLAEQVQRVEELSALASQAAGAEERARQLAEMETRLAEAQAQAERVVELELALSDAQAQAERVAELERALSDAQAQAERVAELERALSDAQAQAERVAELEASLQQALAEAERAGTLEARLAEAEARSHRVEELEQGLSDSQLQAQRLSELEAELSEARCRAERVSELETQLAEAQAQADQVEELERSLSESQAQAQRVTELEASLEEFRARAERVPQLEAELAQAQAVGGSSEKVEELEVRLAQAQSEAAVLMADADALQEARRRLEELESENSTLRVSLAQAAVAIPAAASIPSTDLHQERVTELEAEVASLQKQLADQTATTVQPQAVAPAAPSEFEQLAYEDGLTHLPNFNSLRRDLDFGIKQAERYQRRCALVHVDLDRFQALNEALGVAAGDEVLRQVAVRLQKVVRTSDVLARKGEDDFLIYLSEVSGDNNNPDSVSVVARRIQEMLAPPLLAGNQPVLVSCSVGVSLYPGAATDADQMLHHAYSAMKRAKELGRNQIQFYTDELQKRHDARTTLDAELRKAIEARQFQLLYQPIVHLPTGAIKGVESLLRWAHPAYGVLTPDYFLDVADESGLMVPLGRWVIQQAAQQLYEWARQGLDLFVTVNLTTRQFLQADLVDTIRRALESTGAPAHNFVVEIPESVQMLDIQRVQNVLLALRQAGVRVALDRFGSGFTSLERLHSELVTLLKVDRKFLFHSATNAAALNVTVAALGLARGLRLRPVAVGVENATQLNLCRQLECEYVQGNLIYVPTEADQVSELARAGRLLK